MLSILSVLVINTVDQRYNSLEIGVNKGLVSSLKAVIKDIIVLIVNDEELVNHPEIKVESINQVQNVIDALDKDYRNMTKNNMSSINSKILGTGVQVIATSGATAEMAQAVSDFAKNRIFITIAFSAIIIILSLISASIISEAIRKPLLNLSKVVKQITNQSYDGLIEETFILIECVNDYAKGSFERTAKRLPSKKAIMNEALDLMQDNLKNISKDIDLLIHSASEGNFDVSINSEKYLGYWKRIASDLNDCVKTVEAPVNEVVTVLESVVLADFSNTIRGNYQGQFKLMKEAVNKTITYTSKYISYISSILTKMAQQDLNIIIKREYIGDFRSIKNLMELIVQSFNRLIGEFRSSAEQVASGARQISESSMTLAHGSTPQASSVEQLSVDNVANYLLVGMKQQGKDLVTSEDNKPIYDFDYVAMKKLWDTYYNSIVTGRFIKLGKFGSDNIKTGDALCFIGSTTSAKYFPTSITNKNNETVEIELKVLEYPEFENGNNFAISQGAGMCISKSTKEKEYASSLFLKWFTQTERNVPFSIDSNYLPVKSDALSVEIFNDELKKYDNTNIAMINTIESLKVGVSQLRKFEFYQNAVFDGSVEFRMKLENELLNFAIESRNEYLDLIQSGKTDMADKEEVFSKSAERYNQWIDSLK